MLCTYTPSFVYTLPSYCIYTPSLVYTFPCYCIYTLKFFIPGVFSVASPGVFSVATCLSLVETIDDKLINIEYDRVKHLDVNKKMNTRAKPSLTSKREFLKSLLIKSNLDELHSHISLEDTILQKVANTSKHVTLTDSSTNTDEAATSRSSSSAPLHTPHHPSTQPYSAHEVRIVTPVEDIINSVGFKYHGRREVFYYGQSPLWYGKTLFTKNAYPDPLPAYMVEIFDKLKCIDHEFSVDRYSCMITLYRNGTIAAPQFTDSNTETTSSSDIINITLGATRTYEFINQIGPVNVITHEAVGGSMFTMTEASQSQWLHGIAVSSSTCAPTLTLPFRKTKARVQQVKPPPLGLPNHNFNPKRDILMGKNAHYIAKKSRRTLLLTDSILNGIYPETLSSHKQEIVIKKNNVLPNGLP